MIKYLFLTLVLLISISCSQKDSDLENTTPDVNTQITPEEIDPTEDAGQVAAPDNFPQSISESNGGNF